jgi:hypothetical protein
MIPGAFGMRNYGGNPFKVSIERPISVVSFFPKVLVRLDGGGRIWRRSISKIN